MNLVISVTMQNTLHITFYIVSLVMHDQTVDISKELNELEIRLENIGYPNHCIHSGPIIRNEQEYRRDTLENRQKLLKALMAFFRKIDVKCKTISIEKKHITDPLEAVSKLAKKLAQFIKENYAFFTNYGVVKIYYDNGQIEVTKLLSSVFVSLLENVEFKRVFPSDYRLFQVADLVCSLRLLEFKTEYHELSQAEQNFFENERNIKKNYLKRLKDKSI